MPSTPQRAGHARGRAHRWLAGAGCALVMCVGASAAQADAWHHGHRGIPLIPGNLLLATSEYATPDIQPGVTQLPPECNIATPPDCATAVAGGEYPFSFDNDNVDRLGATTLPGNESFRTIKTAHYGEVLRGISFTPGTSTGPAWGDNDC